MGYLKFTSLISALFFQFRPFFASYNIPSFKLSKFLVPILNPFTTNEFTVDNAFEFVDSITKIPNADNYHMASFDVENLLILK